MNLPAVQCPRAHKDYALLKRTGLAMSPAMGELMPYGYQLWAYVHFIAGKNAMGHQQTCGHVERRLVNRSRPV